MQQATKVPTGVGGGGAGKQADEWLCGAIVARSVAGTSERDEL